MFFWGLIIITKGDFVFHTTSFILIFISFVDIKYRIIPDRLIALLIIPLLISIWSYDFNLTNRLIGGLAISSILIITVLFFKNGIGGGDIKLIGMCGTIIGVENIINAFVLTVISSGFFAIILLFKNTDNKKSIPLGPFVSFGIILSFIWEDFLL